MRVLNNKVKLLGLTLLFATVSSEALTLGRVRGAAWVGQPLEVTIPVQLDAGEEADALCFEADVFHADVRQEARRVRVSVEATAQSQSAHVRVRSSALVDEPVVTLYLRTGCGQKTTRRYVLLADMPSDTAPALAAASPALARAVSAPVLVSARTELAPMASVPAVKPRKVRVAKPPVAKTAVTTSPQDPPSEKKKLARPGGQSRLKLDPLEFLSDRVANLDSFMAFEPPADALRSQQRIQALEQAVNAGQLLAAKNEASLADLKARLQQAESERFPVGVLYGLVALVLASLAAVAFLWHRQRRQAASREDWWSSRVEMQADAAPAPTPVAPVPDPAPDVASQTLSAGLAPGKAPAFLPESPSALGSLSARAVDVNLLDMSDSAFGDFMIDKADERVPPAPSFAAVAAQPRAAVSFSSDSVQDLRQQAEFFVSLGESERAIRLLKRQIDESQAPNPFYYLDLLDILQTHHLKNDFQHWRERFQQIFTGRVPEFALFKREGRDLASYPELLSRLTALWHTPAVLAEIELSLFQLPGINPEPVYDLAAFRDLLLLHAVAQSGFAAAEADAAGAAPALESLAHASLDASAFELAPPASQPTLPPSPPVTPAPQVLDLDLDLNLDFIGQLPIAAEPGPDAGLDFELPGLMDYAVPDDAKPSAEHENLIDFQITKGPPSA
jgi:pilus assembly protein FimV